MTDQAIGSEVGQAPVKVCAVIVTFNRVELLQRTLAAVLAQTTPCSNVVVVDNHSSDGTAAWLATEARDEPRLVIVTMPSNTGGAGGFHAGVKHGYALGGEWLWLMDDDCVAAPDALARLLASTPFQRRADNPALGFLASRVCWTDGSACLLNVPQVARFDWNRLHDVDTSYTKIHAASFVSVLISRAAVKKVGLPVRQFFIWFDDVEYTARISHAGFAAYYIADSTVTHVTPHNVHPQDFGNLKPKDLWKHRYGLRNEVAVETGMRMGWVRGLSLIVRRLYPLWRSGQPASVILTLLMAGLRGLVFDYKRCIEFVDEA
jgi:GT2 family glycosyltransferase